jgi:hypothetical protein
MNTLKLKPSLLHQRHQLSYMQIDALTGLNHQTKYAKDVIKNMTIVKELLLLIDGLTVLNVDFCLLKGPALSQRIYNDSSVRICHDIDFFISFKHISLVYNYLHDRGYQTEYDFSFNEKDLNFLFYHSKDLKFFHPEKKHIVEVHWRLFTYDMVLKSDVPGFIHEYTEFIMFENKQVRVLKKEFELLYILMHGATHKWVMLKWMLDVNDYMKNVNFSEHEFHKLAVLFKLQRVMALYNILAKDYFGNIRLFNTDSLVPSFLVKSCKTEIESTNFPERGAMKLVTRSIRKFKYQFLLIPHRGRRIFLLKKYIRRDLNSKKVRKLLRKQII